MKKSLMTVAIFAALSSVSAFATQPGNNGGGIGGCGVGQQTNGCGTPAGGAGGAGGAGYGGSVLGSGNSSVKNTNQQGQLQDQQQSISRSGNSSISRSGNSRNTNTTNSQGGAGGTVAPGAVVVNNTIATPDNSAQNAAASREIAAATDKAATLAAFTPQVVKHEGIPAATAYAAPLTASNGTCMGSTSAGFQGTLGVSFGTTWTDTSCDIRYDAEALRAANLPQAAIQRLCQKPEIAKAMEASGTPCATAKPTEAVKTSSVAPVVETEQKVAYTDPIVRARLGLPPLSSR
jgi:hypothetical protein